MSKPNEAVERWLPIPGYVGYYEASDQGRVRSFHSGRARILKQTPHMRGYLFVTLCLYGKSRIYTVHKLVMLAFRGSCPPDMEVRHGDGDPTNNHLGNLIYGTHSENMNDALEHGTHNSQGGSRRPQRYSAPERDEVDLINAYLALRPNLL